MDIQTIKLLLDVAQRKSLAAVARAQGFDPSWVSRTVAQAEHDLGFRLFHRTTRHLALTESGEAFLRRMAGVVEEYDRAAEEARGAQAEISGTVRVTASVAFGNARLVPLVGVFRQKFPLLRLELALSDTVLDLAKDRIDIAIRLGPTVEGDVICSKLLDTRYRVCASVDYVASSPHLRRPGDLSHHRCLLFSLEPYRTRWLFRNSRGRITETPVKGDFVASNALALKAAALDGHGPALLADWLIEDDISAGRLIDLFPNHDVAATTFETAAWIVYPSKTFLPARVRETIDFLRSHLT